jgi:putative ATP-dependent endonuclease of OLD family
VYYSAPLDLDMTMLQRFPEAYISTADGSPNFPPESSDQYDIYIRNSIAAVVGDDEKSTGLYEKLHNEGKKLFAWYRYLFLNHSKPATHLQAVAVLEKKELLEKAPEVIIRLLDNCRTHIIQ